MRGIADVEESPDCALLVAMVEVFLSGDVGTPLVMVLTQRSRGAENGSRAIATMRPRIEVSSPMRVYCIGNAVVDEFLISSKDLYPR